MWVAAWMMDRACSRRSARGASGRHSSSSAWPSTPARGARKSWATMFTSSLFMRSSSTSFALVRSRAWYSSALRRMMPIPSASVSRVITWLRLKPPGVVALDVEDRDHLVPGEDGDGHLAARRRARGRRSRGPAATSDTITRALLADSAARDALVQRRSARCSDRAVARGQPRPCGMPLPSGSGTPMMTTGYWKASWMRLHRRLQDALAGQGARDLAHERVDEGELLAALALRREGHGVRDRDRELAGEAREVLEVFVGEGRRARAAGSRSARRTAPGSSFWS